MALAVIFLSGMASGQRLAIQRIVNMCSESPLPCKELPSRDLFQAREAEHRAAECKSNAEPQQKMNPASDKQTFTGFSCGQVVRVKGFTGVAELRSIAKVKINVNGELRVYEVALCPREDMGDKGIGY